MSRAIGVRAMLMTVESSMSTNRPMQVPTSVHQRRLASVSPGTAGRWAAGAATSTSSRLDSTRVGNPAVDPRRGADLPACARLLRAARAAELARRRVGPPQPRLDLQRPAHTYPRGAAG